MDAPWLLLFRHEVLRADAAGEFVARAFRRAAGRSGARRSRGQAGVAVRRQKRVRRGAGKHNELEPADVDGGRGAASSILHEAQRHHGAGLAAQVRSAEHRSITGRRARTERGSRLCDARTRWRFRCRHARECVSMSQDLCARGGGRGRVTTFCRASFAGRCLQGIVCRALYVADLGGMVKVLGRLVQQQMQTLAILSRRHPCWPVKSTCVRGSVCVCFVYCVGALFQKSAPYSAWFLGPRPYIQAGAPSLPRGSRT